MKNLFNTTKKTNNLVIQDLLDTIGELEFDIDSQDRTIDSLKEECESLQEAYESVEEDCESLQEEKLRILAETDNYKKRIKKENETYKTFIESLLPFLDNLERGINTTAGTENYKALKDGFNLALTSYLKTLANFGIENYNSVGEDFDPVLHDALGTQKQYGIEKNKIIEEVTKR